MKHAYLIVAHHQFDILIKTIKILDDENNDFYIHIDKKSSNVPFEDIVNAAKHSQVTFISRMNVNWGGYSQIKCTLCLLKEASKQKYDYMHFISGVDLPIKSKDEIFTFFETHRGEECGATLSDLLKRQIIFCHLKGLATHYNLYDAAIPAHTTES